MLHSLQYQLEYGVGRNAYWVMNFFARFYNGSWRFSTVFTTGSWLFLVNFTTGSCLFSTCFVTGSWLFLTKIHFWFLARISYGDMIFWPVFGRGHDLFQPFFRRGHHFFDGRKINPLDPVSWLISGTPLVPLYFLSSEISIFKTINRVETIRPFFSDHRGIPFIFCYMF